MKHQGQHDPPESTLQFLLHSAKIEHWGTSGLVLIYLRTVLCEGKKYLSEITCEVPYCAQIGLAGSLPLLGTFPLCMYIICVHYVVAAVYGLEPNSKMLFFFLVAEVSGSDKY
jgi:hypothetical protein